MRTDDYGPRGRSPWLDVDWRRHQRWVRVHDRWANVIDLGPRDAPAIVFVHGLGGSWQNWLEQLPVFATDHRVVAVDLPGFGSSEMPREKISIAGYGRWLDALMDELALDCACLVGNSMGGFVSAEVAIRFPHRVERLVLVSAAGLTIEHQRNEPGLSLLRAAEAILAWQTAQVARRADRLVRRPMTKRALLWFVARHPERLPGPLVAEQVRGAGKPGFIDALDALTSYPIRDRIPEIRCPTLVVWGDKDLLVPVRDAYEFHRLIPDSRLHVYEDTGHVAMLERPERFNAGLRAFLTEGAGATARERRAGRRPAGPEEAASAPASAR